LLANELGEFTHKAIPDGVSIHIRHCWRMNFAVMAAHAVSDMFQSTFAIAGE